MCIWCVPLILSLTVVPKSTYDHVVEEHFKRSLGANYQKARSQQLSISLSVDDHFAKALGDKWLQIKSKSSSCSSTPPSSPSVTHSPTYSHSSNQSRKESTSSSSPTSSHWSINWIGNDPWSGNETWLFNISLHAALLIERWKRRRWCWELTDPGVLSLWASMCPNFWHTDECSMNGTSLFCYISTPCLSIASEIQWMVMRDDWKISQTILYISFSFCVILLMQPECHSFVVLYLYSDTSGFLIVWTTHLSAVR